MSRIQHIPFEMACKQVATITALGLFLWVFAKAGVPGTNKRALYKFKQLTN